jgi:hypothetical protein
VNNVINNNIATAYGGGIQISGSNLYIINNTICSNESYHGGAIFQGGNDTIVINSIIWKNEASVGSEIYFLTGSITVNYCNIKDGWPGVHNINSDPFFINPDNGDYHLSIISPCIDAGDNTASSLPATDFEGDPRIIQGLAPGYGKGLIPLGGPSKSGIVDIGADEYCRIKFQKPKNAIQ